MLSEPRADTSFKTMTEVNSCQIIKKNYTARLVGVGDLTPYSISFQ